MSNILQILVDFVSGFLDLIILPYHLYQWFTLPTLKEQLNVFIITGMSSEFFFVVLALITILVGLGIYRITFLRRMVHSLERFNGTLGQYASWFILFMVLQQVLIIAAGQIFRSNEIVFSPLGIVINSNELQWLSGQLKFYNAILIAIASAYTFIEGGHVRVDLFYSSAKYKTKKWIDLIGTIIFLFPSSVLLWWFSWPIAANSLFAQRPMNIFSSSARWRGMRFESSGTAEFTWVWSFKVLIVVFAGLMFLVAVSFLLRNILALLDDKNEIEAHYSLDDSENQIQKTGGN